jgi:hypothetical protein
MCTVTYTPLEHSVLFSSCRDENPNRIHASMPAYVKGKNRHMLYPADGLAGGTWLGVNSAGDVIILLNGGEENHVRQRNYRFSRGIIVKELLDAISPVEKFLRTDLDNIEPFTLIIYSRKELHQLVWTGSEKQHKIPDPLQAHIWSSATLYNRTVQTKRKKWFQTFLKQHPLPTSKQLLQYFTDEAPSDSENGFVMNRNESIKTCSITLIERREQHAVFEYHDLLNGIADAHYFLFQKQPSSLPLPS